MPALVVIALAVCDAGRRIMYSIIAGSSSSPRLRTSASHREPVARWTRIRSVGIIAATELKADMLAAAGIYCARKLPKIAAAMIATAANKHGESAI
jgi:hypothetical protein